MGISDLFRKTDINQEVKNFQNSQNAVLLDVRTKSEYKEGHIPGSTNIPLDEIQNVEDIIKDHDAEILVYCLRGSRSISAVKKLKTLGYKRARSIGGIASYKGLTVLD